MSRLTESLLDQDRLNTLMNDCADRAQIARYESAALQDPIEEQAYRAGATALIHAQERGADDTLSTKIAMNELQSACQVLALPKASYDSVARRLRAEAQLSLWKLTEMLKFQDRLNREVDSSWLEKDDPYLRGVIVKSGKLLECWAWEWWGLQEPDLDRARIELLDIWHYLLSHTLAIMKGDHAKAARHINFSRALDVVQADGRRYELAQYDTKGLIELLGVMSARREASYRLYGLLLKSAGMGWDELYKRFIAKCVLNSFRQDHGYADGGAYVKEWGGKDDEVHLMEIMSDIKDTSQNLRVDLYGALKKRYEEVLKDHQP